MQDLVSFRYDLALGDDVLSAEELAELAERSRSRLSASAASGWNSTTGT